MRLTRKLTFALAGAILLVLSINAGIRIGLELPAYEADMRRDHRLLGRAEAGAVRLIWQRVGRRDALDLVADANERESNVAIRWVWLDAPDGGTDAPEVPSAVRRSDAIDTSVRWRAPGASHDAIYTYVSAGVLDGRPGAVELSEPLVAEDAFVRRTVLQATLSTLILVLVCSVIALGLGAALVGRPVRKLVAQAQRIGAGHLDAKLDVPQRDEIGELAQEMNAMASRLAGARSELERETDARLSAVEQLRHADRLTTVGKLAAGIAHEVGTPLNVIIGYAQLIGDEYPKGESAHEHALIVASQAHRVAAIIRELLDFARPRPPRKSNEDLTLIARQVQVLLGSLALKRDVQLALEAPEAGLRSQVDAGQLLQVLTNLIVNGIHASEPPGRVTITLASKNATPPADHGGTAGVWSSIAVRDRGRGIAPDALPRVFEPFFTTKEPGEGTGLGLSVAYGIVKEHGGWIEVETEVGQGTCFTVFLPLEASESLA